MNKLLQEFDNPNASINDFQNIIKTIPGLSAKLLRIANSAFYAQKNRIKSIAEAIILIGLKSLKNLVIAESLYSSSFGQDAKGYKLGRGELWVHSITTAIAAETITIEKAYKNPDQFFLAGLLHDIGKMLLGPCLTDYIDEIMSAVNNEKISFDAAEQKVLGFDHARIGARVLQFWDLPKLYTDTLTAHHHPEILAGKDTQQYAEIIHIADMLSYNINKGAGIDGKYYIFDKNLLIKYKIDSSSMERITARVRMRYKELFKNLFQAA